jgi:hypothetical protein
MILSMDNEKRLQIMTIVFFVGARHTSPLPTCKNRLGLFRQSIRIVFRQRKGMTQRHKEIKFKRLCLTSNFVFFVGFVVQKNSQSLHRLTLLEPQRNQTKRIRWTPQAVSLPLIQIQHHQFQFRHFFHRIFHAFTPET